MQPYAVIDLGTNTFHLLIAERRGTAAFLEIHRDRQFVKLAEAGIGVISPAAYQCGLDTLARYRHTLDEHAIPPEQLCALGTAALRTATNGPDFIRDAQAICGIPIELISGEREATLIHKGVVLAVPPGEARVLIMDIGGGSVEFIIADKHAIHWAQSFPIGVAVLYRQFHHTDPILPTEMAALKSFLHQTLAPLRVALEALPCLQLAGASGTFDVLADTIGKEGSNTLHAIASPADFYPLYRQIMSLPQERRHELPGIPFERADMIVVALVLLDVVIQMAGIEQIAASAYAMKEGMLYEMMFEQGLR